MGTSESPYKSAHNPKVVGSNPAPATNKTAGQRYNLVLLTFSIFRAKLAKWAIIGQFLSNERLQDQNSYKHPLASDDLNYLDSW